MEKTLKNRRRKTYVLSPEKTARYAVQFALMLLFASDEKFGLAFEIGLLAGLTYSRQNLLVNAPLFIIAGVAFIKDWWTVLHLCFPPVVLLVCCLCFSKAKKNLPSFMTAVVGAISIVPYVVTNVLFSGFSVEIIISVFIAAIFSFCCAIASYAVLFRGIKCRLTLDEKISGGVFVIAVSYVLTSAEISGFAPVWLFAPFVILWFSEMRKSALIIGICFGIGASLCRLSLDMVAVFALIATVSYLLKNLGRFASGAGMIFMASVLCVTGVILWQSLVLLACGIAVYFCLPKRARIYLKTSENNGVSINALVNHLRTELADRLSSVSDVFYGIAKDLKESDDNTHLYTPKRLADDVAKNYCTRCENAEKCFFEIGGELGGAIEPMAVAALSRGKTTILDVPVYISGRCVKINNLISVVNNAGQEYRRKIEFSAENANAKQTVSEELAGVSLILDTLADECGQHIAFFDEDAEYIENELLKHNVVAKETVIVGVGSDRRISLTVRDVDADKQILPRVVSKCMKTKLYVECIENSGDDKIVRLAPCPVFEVAYGIAERTKNGENVSGDNKIVLAPSPSKRIFALCDGMGSGENAHKSSADTVNMIENFYRAGFDNSLILSLVNRNMLVCADDVYSTVDVAVVDTATGGVDIIKLGAASGFIVRKDMIEVIKSSSPPVGIVEKVTPITEKFQLYDGDIVLIASDGVVDALGEKGVIQSIERLKTNNPQTLSDGILRDAISLKSPDDCTVMALRLVAV